MKNQDVKKPAVRELNLNECQQVSGGFLGPDQNVSDFPVWALPRIRVAVQFVKQVQVVAH